MSEGDGNGWVVSEDGSRRWGRYGAAGLLLRAPAPADPETPLVLLQHRAVWTASGDTWALPGGARDSHEDAAQAALRETQEEAEVQPSDVTVRGEQVTSRMQGTVWHRPGLDMRHAASMLSRMRPDSRRSDAADVAETPIPPLAQESTAVVEWTYTTVSADAPRPLETVANNESLELRWVPEDQVADMPLMPAFAQAWETALRSVPVELVVDVANVVGSRPDGWWKDRAGATERLLDEIGADLPRTIELPGSGEFGGGFGWIAGAHAVIEGAAKKATHEGPFDVHRAPGEGDDTIVELATDLARGSRRVLVVTADRGLRARLPENVLVVGPRAVRR